MFINIIARNVYIKHRAKMPECTNYMHKAESRKHKANNKYIKQGLNRFALDGFKGISKNQQSFL